MEEFNVESKSSLVKLLNQCLAQIEGSKQPDNSLKEKISNIKKEVENNSRIDKKSLDVLFSPTGPLQDLAGMNSWEKEFEELSKKWDEILDFS